MTAKISQWLLVLSVLAVGLLLLPAPALADSYVGGIPLSTVEEGTVSGGVYIDAYPSLSTPSFSTDATKIFTLPGDATTVQWARLYVVVYCGSMEENYDGKVTTSIDGGNAGSRDYSEDLNVPYSFPGEGGTGPVILNDHCNRVTSDYLMWYDVAPYLSSGTLTVHATTEPVSSSFDGRIKAIVLVAAYDDGDNDTVCYWVNQGHDTDSYKADKAGNPYVGETEFSTGELEDGFETADLTVLYLASKDAEYQFNGDALDGKDPDKYYFGKDEWEVADSLAPGRDAGLTYDRLDTETFYKVFGAVLAVRYPEAEVGSIAVSSSPEGATVYVDDEEAGVTNTTISGLDVDDHTVRVEKDGYEVPDERTVTVEKGATTPVSFVLSPLTGSISVASEPSGAAILLDGVDTGKTTDAVIDDVPVGSHTIALALAGYDQYSTDVAVEEDSVAEVQAVLTTSGSSDDDGDGDGADSGSGYAGGSLDLVRHGSVAGNLSIVTASNYTGVIPVGATCRAVMDPGLPDGATVREARLYLFSTWANDEDRRIGCNAQVALAVNGTSVRAEKSYLDRKGEGSYDYPVETFVYNVTSLVGGGNLTVTASNAGTGSDTFALYGFGLVLVYETPDAPTCEYWIAEGSDVVLADDAEAATTALFPDLPDPAQITGARLTVLSTAATGDESQANAVDFNGGEWENVLNAGSSAISAATVDAFPYLLAGENAVSIKSIPENGKGDYMENRLAVLAVTRSAAAPVASSVQPGAIATTSASSAAAVQGSENNGTVSNGSSAGFDWASSLFSMILSLFGIQPADDGDAAGTDIPAATGDEPVTTVTTAAPLQPCDLLVTSVPEGALIYLDGVYTGHPTPFVFASLQPGTREIRLEHEFYDPVAAEITATEDMTFTANLSGGTYAASAGSAGVSDSGTGCIFVNSKPDGATIVLDGRTLSYTTPRVICGLKPGLHTVKIKNGNGNFPIDSVKCYVEAGAVTPILFSQDQVRVRSVTITSEQRKGTEFSVNGKRLNTKIPKTVDVAGISSFVSIKNATGYYSFEVSDFLDDGEECVLSEPAPATAGVHVASDPSGAEIFVDGFDTGFATPFTIENVSPGPHLVTVSRPGYIPEEQRILLVDNPGQPDDVDLSFVLEGYPSGSLTVTSDTPGGKIYLYGKDTGKVTPYTFEYMHIGRYEVKVRGENGSTSRDDIVVMPGTASTYTFTMDQAQE